MDVVNQKETFYKIVEDKTKKYNSLDLTGEKYESIIERLTEIENNKKCKKTSKDYRLLERYVVKVTEFQGAVVKQLLNRKTGKIFIKLEDVFDIIHNQHIEKGHNGRIIN